MHTTTHKNPSFDGPYFSDMPKRKGKSLWKSELSRHGSGHPATMLAGAWYAIGLGTQQCRDTLKLLRDAEYWERHLGGEHAVELGLNLACQGFALMNLGSQGLAARRLREAASQLEAVGYDHSGDLVRIQTSLSRAEGALYGPVAGLVRLHSAREHYAKVDRFEVLREAVAVRGELLDTLLKSDFGSPSRDYLNQGKHQRDAHAVGRLVETTVQSVRALLMQSDTWQATCAAHSCVFELLENCNLRADDIRSALETLDELFTILDDVLRHFDQLATAATV
ncbi:hypothetical protein [Methylibium sp.]|uniref:hypothetical protein n=1 Tax=Methylibium sp. TaxID=2067992 RepID=UPI001848D946|nr:hypothetical protein [Methylibium sp.]MBA3590597.1 hypothetical protein [Methylibium sp.]